MTLLRFEVGFVGADRGLVDFLAEVFELEELVPMEMGPGTLYRLDSPGAVIKVLVPSTAPKARDPDGRAFDVTGLGYLSLWVEDLDAVLGRAVERGARVQYGPAEFRPGTSIAVLVDPYGNTMEIVGEG